MSLDITEKIVNNYLTERMVVYILRINLPGDKKKKKVLLIILVIVVLFVLIKAGFDNNKKKIDINSIKDVETIK